MFYRRILPQIIYPDKEDGSGATPTVTAVFTAVPTPSSMVDRQLWQHNGPQVRSGRVRDHRVALGRVLGLHSH